MDTKQSQIKLHFTVFFTLIGLVPTVNATITLPPQPDVVIVGKRDRSSSGAPFQSPRRIFSLPEKYLPGDRKTLDPNAANTNIGCPTVGPATNPATPRPVIIATGEKIKEETDFVSANPYGLSLFRTYRSMQNDVGMFGPKWYSNFEHSGLGFTFSNCTHTRNGDCIPQSVTFTDGTGTKLVYTYAGWTDDGNMYTYTVNGNAAAGELVYTFKTRWILTNRHNSYVYSSGGKLQSISDRAGATTTYLYQNAGRLSQITDATKLRSVYFTWNANNRVSAIKDSAGNVWNYAYNANNMLSKVTSPGATPTVREYFYEGADPSLLTGIAINGVRYSNYSYYDDGRVSQSGLVGNEEVEKFSYATDSTTVTDALGQATTYQFQSFPGAKKLLSTSRAPTSTCPAAAVASINYDSAGNPVRATDWNGSHTLYTIEPGGKVQSITTGDGTADALTTTETWDGENIVRTDFRGARGETYAFVEYTYPSVASQASDRLESVTRTDKVTGAKHRTEYQYTFHPSGILASVTETEVRSTGNVVTVTKFDTMGDLVSRTNGLNHQETYSNYNSMGLPRRHVDINGVATELSYNEVGNLLSATKILPSGNLTTTYTYTPAGQISDIAYPDGSASRMRYTASGRLEKLGNALNEYVQFGVDMAALRSDQSSSRHVPSSDGTRPVANPATPFMSSTYIDSLGRPRIVAGNNGQQTIYKYDASGNPKFITDGAGHTTTQEFDAHNRLRKITNALGEVTEMHYDSAGNLQWVRDPRSLQTSYTYNGFGQVLTRTSPDTGKTTYTYDAAGLLDTETDADNKVTYYDWDALGRMTTRSSGGVTQTFTYDEGAYGKGKLTRVNDSTGQTTYTYNAAGQLVSQVNNIYGNVYTTTWNYDAAGRLAGMVYPTGLTLGYGYDGAGRLASVSSNLGGVWSTLANNFLYQPATNQLYAWRFGNGLPRMLTLDADGRVERLATPGKHDLSFGYSNTNTITSIVDAVGNRASNSPGAQGAYTYTIEAQSNRLASWSGAGKWRSFGYNNAGSVVSESRDDGGRTYTYNTFGQLSAVHINGTHVGDYRSNAFNQRVYKIIGGVGTAAIYGPGGELLAEIGPQSSSYVWLSGQLFGVNRAGQFYASHNDQVGRPEVLTGADSAVVWRAENAAFDRRRVVVDSIGGLNIGFPGQYFDAESGLWYNWNRYYDASLGRYIQSDPIGLAGGINTYAYVEGNPLSRVDPLGLWPLRMPDYGTFTLPTFIPAVGITITLDRAGNVYLGPSAGVSLPGGSGRAWGVGWTGDRCKPSSDRLKDFLGGWGANAGVGLGVTWSSPQAPGNEAPNRMGMNIQTPGFSVGYNWHLGQTGVRW